MALIIKTTRIRKARERIKKALKSGKTVVYPTETCYGLGCIISSRNSVKKIYELKGKPKGSPLSVIVSGIGMMREYAVAGKEAEALARKFMPGPLTLVLGRTKRVPKWFPGEKIGIRISGNETARTLCRLAGEPIVSTSANLSGKKPLYSIEGVKRVFSEKVGLIIDAGDLRKRMPSTVFDLENRRILRKGAVSRKKIIGVLGERK